MAKELIEEIDSILGEYEGMDNKDTPEYKLFMRCKSALETAESDALDKTVDRLRGQLQNCVSHLERAKNRCNNNIYDNCIESANKALYETLNQ